MEVVFESKRKTLIGGLILAIFPILAQYEFTIMNYGMVLIILYSIVLIILNGGEVYINKGLILFIIYTLVQQLIIYSYTGTFKKNLNTYLFMFVCIFVLAICGQIDMDSYIKIYYWIGTICCILVLYQFFLANIMGRPQSAMQILPVSLENQHYWLSNSNRVSGVFTEPQAFSAYILPLLVVSVFKKQFKMAGFITVSIFASTSSQGIILAGVVWLFYMFIYKRNTADKIIKCIVAGASVILLFIVFSRIEMFSFIIDKILSVNIFKYDIRLTKGFQIYFSMPFMDQMTGIGFGNLKDYLQMGNFHFAWMALTQEKLLDYITTMANVLVSFGIGGIIFYINAFWKNRSTRCEEAKVVLLLIFISSFTQTILFNAWFVYYWLVFEVFDNSMSQNYLRLRFTLGKKVLHR